MDSMRLMEDSFKCLQIADMIIFTYYYAKTVRRTGVNTRPAAAIYENLEREERKEGY